MQSEWILARLLNGQVPRPRATFPVNAEPELSQNLLGFVVAREADGGGKRQDLIANCSTKRESVHNRHHHVEQHEAGELPTHLLDGLVATRGLEEPEGLGILAKNQPPPETSY